MGLKELLVIAGGAGAVGYFLSGCDAQDAPKPPAAPTPDRGPTAIPTRPAFPTRALPAPTITAIAAEQLKARRESINSETARNLFALTGAKPGMSAAELRILAYEKTFKDPITNWLKGRDVTKIGTIINPDGIPIPFSLDPLGEPRASTPRLTYEYDLLPTSVNHESIVDGDNVIHLYGPSTTTSQLSKQQENLRPLLKTFAAKIGKPVEIHFNFYTLKPGQILDLTNKDDYKLPVTNEDIAILYAIDPISPNGTPTNQVSRYHIGINVSNVHSSGTRLGMNAKESMMYALANELANAMGFEGTPDGKIPKTKVFEFYSTLYAFGVQDPDIAKDIFGGDLAKFIDPLAEAMQKSLKKISSAIPNQQDTALLMEGVIGAVTLLVANGYADNMSGYNYILDVLDELRKYFQEQLDRYTIKIVNLEASLAKTAHNKKSKRKQIRNWQNKYLWTADKLEVLRLTKNNMTAKVRSIFEREKNILV